MDRIKTIVRDIMWEFICDKTDFSIMYPITDYSRRQEFLEWYEDEITEYFVCYNHGELPPEIIEECGKMEYNSLKEIETYYANNFDMRGLAPKRQNGVKLADMLQAICMELASEMTDDFIKEINDKIKLTKSSF
jgi:hypothetical protein